MTLIENIHISITAYCIFWKYEPPKTTSTETSKSESGRKDLTLLPDSVGLVKYHRFPFTDKLVSIQINH